MNKILLSLIGLGWCFIFSQSCVGIKSKIDMELEPYVADYYNKFHEICPKKMNSLATKYKVIFGKGDKWIGMCYYQFDGYKIVIDREWWARASPMSREQTMGHELSHCVLGLAHNESVHHYMYYQEVYIPMEDYYAQLKRDMERFCEQQ